MVIRLVERLALPPGKLGAIANDASLKPAKLKLIEILAGICLAFSILKPTLTILAATGVLIWALFERKNLLIVGFIASLGGLCLASWLAIGNWVPDYYQLLKTTGGAPVLWSLAMLAWPWNALYVALSVGIVVTAFILFLRKRLRAQWFSAAILAGLALFPMRWIYDLLLGILVPAEAQDISPLATASIVIALMAPWGLALFPEPLRWPAQVIGLPLVWAFVWLVQLLQSLAFPASNSPSIS